MRKSWSILLILIAVTLLTSCAGNDANTNPDLPQPVQPPLIAPQEEDPMEKLINSMSLEEKLGQMLIAGIQGYEVSEGAVKLIEEHKIGGFILFGSNIKSASQLTSLVNSLKGSNRANKLPLLISVDEEGGRISRIPKSIKNVPTSEEVGRTRDEEFANEIGKLLAEKVGAFGFNMNFAPVLDINSNPNNPVIGNRAFGSSKEIVRDLGVQTMLGIKQKGIIPVIKHFPGHGDTSVDSHIGLPKVMHDLKRLKAFELAPFEQAIRQGADCVMVAHILLPSIDPDSPATLSKTMITDILRKQLDFQGVVITDDMTMGAIVQNYEIGEAAVQSINAGSDIILVAHQEENVLAVLNAVKAAVEQGSVTEEQIDSSVYRIIKLKQAYQLSDEAVEAVDIKQVNNRIDEVLNRYFR